MRIFSPTISGSLVVSGSITTTGVLSASSFTGDGSGLTGVTSYTDTDTLNFINSINVLSGSIDWDTLEGKPSGIVSSSSQVSFTTISDKPTLVSGSSQINFASISNKPTLISGSAQISSLGFTTCTGTVTSVGGTGTVNGLTLSGTVISSGSITLGGTLSNINLTSQVTGTLPVSSGGTGLNCIANGNILYGNSTNSIGNSSNFTWDETNRDLAICHTSSSFFTSFTQFHNSFPFNKSFSSKLYGPTATGTLFGQDVCLKSVITTNNTLMIGSEGFATCLILGASSDGVMIIDDSANVGIGTTSPTNKLDVVGAVSASTYYGDGSNLTGITAGISGTGTSGYIAKWNGSSSQTNSLIYENGTTVGIGTTQSEASAKLLVGGSISSGSAAIAQFNGFIRVTDYVIIQNSSVLTDQVFLQYDTIDKGLVIVKSGTANGHIRPGTNGTQNLGSSTYRWNTVYTSDLSLKNDLGDWTIVEGEEDLFLYNNKKDKVYKFNLTEVDKDSAPKKRS